MRHPKHRTSSQDLTPRLLAAVSFVLAIGCAGLAVAWKHKADEAACWREALIDDERFAVAAADCSRGSEGPRLSR